MRIIKASAELVNPPSYESVLATVEAAGRVCYKSESKIADGTAERFISNVIGRGHEAVIEHASVTIRFICDRGVSHEIVRHRVASYCQESTRYCNYADEKFGGEITVIEPCFFERGTQAYECWRKACECTQFQYLYLLNIGCTPQQARAVLPNSLKTEVVMTANMREWRHFFRLRTAASAHPQMVEVASIALDLMKKTYPVFFEDF